MGKSFNYIEEFKSPDLNVIKQDIFDLIIKSQDCWPTNYGQHSIVQALIVLLMTVVLEALVCRVFPIEQLG